MEFVLSQLYLNSGPVYPKSAILVSRLSRGGKTTTLMAFFDALKRVDDVNPMIISFNGNSGYSAKDGETKEEALFRTIVEQFTDGSQLHEMNWQTLDSHIGTKPFVLIIDEINALEYPIGKQVANVLKTYFVKPKNRFLIMSSHWPVSIEAESDNDNQGVFHSTVSYQPMKIISLPVCSDITAIRQMGEECQQINQQQIAYYGNIPSLLYTTFQNRDSLRERFTLHRFVCNRLVNELYDFLEEVMNVNMTT